MISSVKNGKHPFMSRDVKDDLSGYCRKIVALGKVMGALAWLENHTEHETEVFKFYGETYGDIISDYADGINRILDKGIWETLDFPIGEYQKFYDRVHDMDGKDGDVGLINEVTNELLTFSERTAIPAIQVANKFRELREKIQNQMKTAFSTSAAAPAA